MCLMCFIVKQEGGQECSVDVCDARTIRIGRTAPTRGHVGGRWRSVFHRILCGNGR